MKRIRTAPALLLLPVSLCAQWLNFKTPGIPRTPDGKPNLTAPAPRTADGHPDLSGQWTIIFSRYDLSRDLKPEEIQPWARALQKQRADTHQTALQTCLPIGPLNSAGTLDQEIKIVQTPNLIVILYGDLTYRQVFLDGRSLEKDPNPSWMGYSVGHWEGATLVVESNGYNDRTWLDSEGHPHSEGLRVTERFRRTDFGRMDLNVTFEDPAVYARPIEFEVKAVRKP